ncbi:hypothetical protein [Butyrivibrio sp. AE2032]|uniref:hypothetical protein n=1 Tax=Butyrivibrio sp. AE2032 TaxID=1458463 RepID=UPI0005574016|nr:hypothetical protein [Butyrivibrio sp. AE2032]
MDSFIDALLSEKTDKIPDGYDWFAPLIGDWDCDYYDEFGGRKRLCFTKEDDKLVGKVLDQEDVYWIFSDITADGFRWENVIIRKDGTRIQDCEIHGKRIK